MKWLSGGLTFVNCAIFSALLLGILAGGLNRGLAWLCLIVGLIAAVAAFVSTRDNAKSDRHGNRQ